MVSDLAISEIEAMKARGLSPTVRDIVRLNELALRIERGTFAAEYYALPRVAILKVGGGEKVLTQPTIAHEIWLNRVAAVVDMDVDGEFACNLYAATHPTDALCNPADRKAVRREVQASLESFRPLTFETVRLALDYVLHGGTPADCVHAPPPPNAPDLPEGASIALAVLNDGVALRLGVSVKDMAAMTRGQLLAVTHAALGLHRGDGPKEMAARRRMEFFRALDEIAARLEGERDAAKGGAANG